MNQREMVQYQLSAGGVAYDYDANGIYFVFSTATGTSVMRCATQSNINSATDIIASEEFISGANLVENDKLQLYANADATQGTGTFNYRIKYSIQEVQI